MLTKLTAIDELRWYRFEHDLSPRWLLHTYRLFKKNGFFWVF
jgi:hypothetical protein